MDRSSALQYLRSMVKRKRYDRKDHEMAKRHDRRYHGEAYLFVLCCFCKGPTLELLVFLVRSCHLSTEFLLHRGHGELRFDHRYALSPRTIITVLPLFYLTCRRIPGPPVFQRETLKSWEWAWGRGYLHMITTPWHQLYVHGIPWVQPYLHVIPTPQLQLCIHVNPTTQLQLSLHLLHIQPHRFVLHFISCTHLISVWDRVEENSALHLRLPFLPLL